MLRNNTQSKERRAFLYKKIFSCLLVGSKPGKTKCYGFSGRNVLYYNHYIMGQAT